MNADLTGVSLWLADFHLLAAALLLGVLLVLTVMRQPARRMAVIKSTLGALAVLAGLSALPGWSVVHLVTNPPQASVGIDADRGESPLPTITVGSPVGHGAYVRPQQALSEPTAAGAKPQAATSGKEVGRAAGGWEAILLGGYALGSSVVLLWLIIGAVMARRICRAAARAPMEMQHALRQIAGAGKAPRLLVSGKIATPVAVGTYAPSIILPRAMVNPEGHDKLAPILAHELAHIRSGDLRTLAASRLLLVLVWPQPLYWLLRRGLRLDQEALADAAAADVAGRVDYAEQLLGWARQETYGRTAPRLAGAVGLWEAPSQLKRRIALLLNEKFAVMRTCSRRWRGACFAVIAMATVGLSLMTLQPATRAADETAKESEAPTAIETQHSSPGRGTFTAVKVGTDKDAPSYKKNGLKLTIIDEAEAPVADVEVQLYRTWHQKGTHELAKTTRTDARGEVEFVDVLPADRLAEYEKFSANGEFPYGIDESFLVVLRRPGLSTVGVIEMAYEIARNGSNRVVLMRPAAELRGRVYDPQGRPVAGATVAAGGLASSFVIEGVNAVKTDADGQFVFADRVAFDAEAARKKMAGQLSYFLAADSAKVPESQTDPAKPVDPAEDTDVSDLVVRHPDYAVTKLEGGNVPGTTDIRMQPAAAITGKVSHHGSGKPASGVTVRAYGSLPMKALAQDTVPLAPDFHSAATVTDSQGFYRLVNLPAGTYDLWAQPPGQRFEQVDWVSRGHGAIKAEASRDAVEAPDIVIGPPGKIRGQLIDAETREPLRLPEGAVVQPYLMLVGGPQMQYTLFERVFAAADGSFEMHTMPGKTRSGAFVFLGADRNKFPVAYQCDDDVHSAGEVFSVGHGETIEAVFPVYTAKRLGELRAAEQKGHNLTHEKKYAEAIAAFDELLQSDASHRGALVGRGYARRLAGQFAEAIADFERVLELYPGDEQAKYVLADLLATSPVAETRDGARAVKLAEAVLASVRLQHAGDEQEAGALSMLAAAHADVGEFAKASAEQQQAIKLSTGERRAGYEKRLELYKSGKAYRREVSELKGPATSGSRRELDSGWVIFKPVAPKNTELSDANAGRATLGTDHVGLEERSSWDPEAPKPNGALNFSSTPKLRVEVHGRK